MFFIVHVQSVFLCSSTAAIDVLFTVRFCFSFNKAPSLWICLLFSQIHFSRLLKPVSLNFSQIIIRESYRKFILKHVVKDSTVLPFFFKSWFMSSVCHSLFVSLVHLQHAGQVSGQQPTRSQQPSSAIEKHCTHPVCSTDGHPITLPVSRL